MDDEIKKTVEKLKKENEILTSEIKRFEELLTNTTIGVYRTTPDGEILFVNKPLLKILGFNTIKELKKHNLEESELISKKERQTFKELLDKQDYILGHEAQWLNKDKKTIYVRESAKAIKDSNRKIIYYEGTIEDITAQKIKENQLIESEERYKKLVELLPYGVIMHKNDEIHYINNYGIDLLKIKKSEEYFNKNLFDFIHPSYHVLVKSRIKTILKELKKSELVEQIFVDNNGKNIPVEVSTIPIYLNNEIYLLSIFSDITERKKAEKELRLSEITYRGLLNSISEGLLILDESNKIVDVNQTANNLFGIEYNKFIGHNFFDFFKLSTEEKQELNNKINKIFNNKSKSELIILNCIKDNDITFPGEISIVKGVFFEKNVAIAVVRDISERIVSESKYKELFEFAVGGILIGTLNGYITDANNYMCKIFGMQKEDIIGKHINDGFFTEECYKSNPLDFKNVHKGKIVKTQRTVLRPDGSTIEVEMYTKMFPDGTLQSFYHDITDRKYAETQLQKEREKTLINYANLQAIIENIKDNIWAIDTNYRILYLNKSFKDNCLYYFHIDLKPGINILDILDENQKIFWKEKYDYVFQNHKLEFEQKIIAKNKNIYLNVSLNPIVKNNKVIGISCFGSDITDIKLREKEILEAKEKAEESDRLKSAFLANMSHEIRTPMNGILGFLDLLKDDEITTKERKEYINIIENSANQLLATLNDIIELSKIEAGIIIKNTEPVNYYSLVSETVTQMQGSLPKDKDIKLYLKSNSSTQQIYGITDSIKLRQILINLICNSIKFTNKGYIEVSIEKISDSYISISIKDTGIGIKPEHLNNIFDRFTQINNDASNIPNNNGSGLGLSICKAYAELLNGKITVNSEYGKGSTFTVTIPIIC